MMLRQNLVSTKSVTVSQSSHSTPLLETNFRLWNPTSFINKSSETKRTWFIYWYFKNVDSIIFSFDIYIIRSSQGRQQTINQEKIKTTKSQPWICPSKDRTTSSLRWPSTAICHWVIKTKTSGTSWRTLNSWEPKVCYLRRSIYLSEDPSQHLLGSKPLALTASRRKYLIHPFHFTKKE